MIIGDVLLGGSGMIVSFIFLSYIYHILGRLEQKSQANVTLFIRDQQGHRAFILLAFSIFLFSFGLFLAGIVRILSFTTLYTPVKAISGFGIALLLVFMQQTSKNI